MKTMIAIASVLMLATSTPAPIASGPLGIYCIVEKVIFEPNAEAPARLQLWGAFMFVDGGTGQPGATSSAKRGYMYFSNPGNSDVVLKEWSDLKSVAGTGQAVGFGAWIYIGAFSGIQPDQRSQYGIYHPSGGDRVDLRVRLASEPPATAVTYLTNAGVVKLPEGSHAAVVKALRDALKQP